MLDFLYNIFYYGTLTNLVNIGVFVGIEYLYDDVYFVENMKEYGLSVGMYMLDKYNVIHKKYLEKEKENVRKEREYYTLYTRENKIEKVNDANVNFIHDKYHVNVVYENGIYFEANESIQLDDLQHLTTDIVPTMLSIELIDSSNNKTYDVKELLPYYLYDGMTLSTNILRFMLLKHHNHIIDTDNKSNDYILKIIDENVDIHKINIRDKYVVLDQDRELGFFTLSK